VQIGSPISVPDRICAAGIGADVVALDDVSIDRLRTWRLDLDSPNGAVAADDISGRRRSPADGIVVTVDNDPTCLRAQARGSGDVGANEIALYEIELGVADSDLFDGDADA